MIDIVVDEVSLSKVQKRLGVMHRKAPMVMSRSLNKTAVSARQRLADRAQKSYTVKSTKFRKNMTIKKATYGRLEAVIRSEGKPLAIVSFKYSSPKSGAKAQIVEPGSLKALVLGNIKAFKKTIKVTRKDSSETSHTGIFQREGKSRLPIKQLYSNSIPVMIGNEKRVYGLEREKIESDLRKYLEAQIEMLISGGGD